MTVILKSPNKILLKKSTDVDLIEAKKIVEALSEVTKKVDTLYNFWLGMAAPQIGISKRVFILRTRYKQYQEFINPEIIEKKISLPAISHCYSVSGIAFLERYYWIKVKYKDLNGEEYIKNFFGPNAFVVQHEVDHLNGKLIK